MLSHCNANSVGNDIDGLRCLQNGFSAFSLLVSTKKKKITKLKNYMLR